ncbi:MAG: hypothetical protein WBB01_07130 [Phormidesmis sp.]
MRSIKLACLTLLLVVLTGCGVLSQTPPNQAVKLALAQQLTNTQQTLAQDLGIFANDLVPNFKIDRLTVDSRQKLAKSSLQRDDIPGDAYRVRGTFEATLIGSSRQIQQSSPFEIYLGADPNGDSETQTWFLFRPQPDKKPV